MTVPGRDYLFAVVPHNGYSMRVSNFSMAAVSVVREWAVPANTCRRRTAGIGRTTDRLPELCRPVEGAAHCTSEVPRST